MRVRTIVGFLSFVLIAQTAMAAACATECAAPMPASGHHEHAMPGGKAAAMMGMVHGHHQPAVSLSSVVLAQPTMKCPAPASVEQWKRPAPEQSAMAVGGDVLNSGPFPVTTARQRAGSAPVFSPPHRSTVLRI